TCAESSLMKSYPPFTASILAVCSLPSLLSSSFFFNAAATTEIYTLSLHDALPISFLPAFSSICHHLRAEGPPLQHTGSAAFASRSEEHTSELQSRENLVCRLLLEKKKRLIITPR